MASYLISIQNCTYILRICIRVCTCICIHTLYMHSYIYGYNRLVQRMGAEHLRVY